MHKKALPSSPKFLDRGQLVERLTSQVGSRQMATQLLVKRGHMTPDGKLTKEGERLNNMTASERAIERQARYSGRSTNEYGYNELTNKAKLLNNATKEHRS